MKKKRCHARILNGLAASSLGFIPHKESNTGRLIFNKFCDSLDKQRSFQRCMALQSECRGKAGL